LGARLTVSFLGLKSCLASDVAVDDPFVSYNPARWRTLSHDRLEQFVLDEVRIDVSSPQSSWSMI